MNLKKKKTVSNKKEKKSIDADNIWKKLERNLKNIKDLKRIKIDKIGKDKSN